MKGGTNSRRKEVDEAWVIISTWGCAYELREAWGRIRGDHPGFIEGFSQLSQHACGPGNPGNFVTIFSEMIDGESKVELLHYNDRASNIVVDINHVYYPGAFRERRWIVES